MDRKLIRPSLASRRSAPASSASRRHVSETTHAEAGYLVHAIESQAPFFVELLGGEKLSGRLEGHDRDALILALAGGTTVVLRKERIRAYWAETRPSGAGTDASAGSDEVGP